MAFKEGDFILVDYTAKVKETGAVIETTREDVAKSSGIYRDDEIYEPALIILGEHRVVRGLEEALMEMDVGEEKVIEVGPEKAYGERDPRKVVIMSLREFTRRGIRPRPGDVVNIGGRLAVIRSVTGGRVTVDFNHPLAGKTLVFEVKVLKKIESPEDKVRALIKRRLKLVKEEDIKVEISEGVVKVELPQGVYLVENIQYVKGVVAREVFKFIEGVNEVAFIERYKA